MLVVARTETALSRLLDVVSLIQHDRRIQIVFTTDPDNPAVFRAGLDEHLAALSAPIIPWAQATSTRFDLAIAASENDGLDQLDAPVLLVSHGLGHQKYYPDSDVVAGMNPARLLRGNAVVPQVIALPHTEQQADLARICPPAEPRAAVIGDPTLDRLLAGRFRADGYRAALDATGKTLVVLSSTWGPESLLANDPTLPERMVAALPVDEFRVALLLHSGVWSAHGPWQVRAWLGRAVELGLHLVEPAGNWQAVLTAAQCLVSDEGSLALYAAALDRPILLVESTGAKTVTGSPLARLAERAPRLHQHHELRTQIEAAIGDYQPGTWEPVMTRAVAHPGECAEVLRPVLYDLIGLPEPANVAEFGPVPVPPRAPHRIASMFVGVAEDDDILVLQRFPAGPSAPLPHQHIVADVDLASYRALAAASILLIDVPRGEFSARANALLAQWPRAELVAMRIDEATVWIADRHGISSVSAPQSPAGFDPALLASVVFVRRRPGPVTLRVGGRVTEIVRRPVEFGLVDG